MTISLDRYQELMTLPVNAFNGVNKPDENPRYACSTIWKKSDRDNLHRFLQQAEFMREQELGYFLSPKETVEETFHGINNPFILSNKYLRELGKLNIDSISDDILINHRDIYNIIIDPIVITIGTTVIDVDEIKVYKKDYSGAEYEVTPSYINISNGILTLKIPRARLVKPDLLDDREDHLMYDDDTNFVDYISIKRHYYKLEQAIEYFWPSCDSFDYITQTGYGVIKDHRLSIIEAYPADWNAGIPTPKWNLCWRRDASVKISYVSGLKTDVPQDIMTIRLAHSLMPFEPCTCDPVHQYWQNDVIRDPSNISTPYGSSVAAVAVWIADSRARIGYSTTTGGIRR